MNIVPQLITNVLQQMAQLQPLAPAQQHFIQVLLSMMLTARGKLNCLNLSRYGALHERTLRRGLRREFDWLTFNRLLLAPLTAPANTLLVALDASFIAKSGKRTYGLDRFYNGCASRVQQGLEVSLVALIDVTANTAYALSVQQTPGTATPSPEPGGETRLDFYLKHLQAVVAQGGLPPSVQVGVFDGAFAHRKFVDGVAALGLVMVSKLRCDANLRYLYTGPQKPRGRRRLYDGKVDFADLRRWQDVGAVGAADTAVHLYTVVAHHPALHRVVRVVLVRWDKHPHRPRFALLFSTDVNLSAAEILGFYQARFQMEYLFRDAKGWTGLTDCQARHQAALHCHFNASLGAVNLAKLQARLTPSPRPCATPRTVRAGFSLASWKQRAFNQHLLDLIIDNLGLEPSWVKSHPRYDYLCNYGSISN